MPVNCSGLATFADADGLLYVPGSRGSKELLERGKRAEPSFTTCPYCLGLGEKHEGKASQPTVTCSWCGNIVNLTNRTDQPHRNTVSEYEPKIATARRHVQSFFKRAWRLWKHGYLRTSDLKIIAHTDGFELLRDVARPLSMAVNLVIVQEGESEYTDAPPAANFEQAQRKFQYLHAVVLGRLFCR